MIGSGRPDRRAALDNRDRRDEMKKTLIAVAALSTTLVGASSALAGMPPMAMGHEAHAVAAASPRLSVQLHKAVVRVAIHNFAFQPARLKVSRGTRVVWVNRDGDPHTVSTSAKRRAGGWASQALDTGNSYAHVMSRAGSFSYICTIHPFMHGTVVVGS
jgi:plastocyanin